MAIRGLFEQASRIDRVHFARPAPRIADAIGSRDEYHGFGS
jgi:hypothetical protein